MARAAGKRSKKRGKRRHPPRAKKKPVARRDLDNTTIVQLARQLAAVAERANAEDVVDARLAARPHTVAVAPSALEDPEGADDIRRGLPALDPALLPELVLLQHVALKRFNLGPGSTYPQKKTLEDFFLSVQLSDGKHLSPHLASAMATFVRPLTARRGGRPLKKR